MKLNFAITAVLADVYMHHPRGSNDKLNEQSNNRNNGNRLFDSQNNANGGYQVGDRCKGPCLNDDGTYNTSIPGAGQGIMEYFEGSELQIEWTNQHGSQNPRLHTQVVLQYACDDNDYSPNIRDGRVTTTIPDDPNAPELQKYGEHESHSYYSQCKVRQRNKGLFLADQNLNGDTARFTRQDNNGNRNGLECPEERDYYPYWHRTPFRDIAVCTDQANLCPWYQANSQNVVDKGECSDPQWNNQAECEYNKNTWNMVGRWNQPAPQCSICQTTRNNHLGNTASMTSPNFQWTIPENVHKDGAKCFLRIRYNISTFDYDQWNTNSKSNAGASPIKGNPTADFLGFGQNVSGPLKLAIDTDQNARTFQDRSHMFIIRKRPKDLQCGLRSPNCRIVNLNVRGRRGNIVQVYPSVEYDYVPSLVNVSRGDYLHVQFCGADSNSQGNDGQGRQGTDRNNMVLVDSLGKNYPLNLNPTNAQPPNHFTTQQQSLIDLAFLKQENCDPNSQDNQANDNCKLLNAAQASNNFGLIRVDNTGKFILTDTRNNRFSNREQKLTIVSNEDAATVAGAVVITVSGFGILGALVLFGYRRAKRNPYSKLNRLYGTNKPVNTAEFDDVEATPGKSTEQLQPVTWREKYAWFDRMCEYYEWNFARIWFITLFVLCNAAVWIYGYASNLGVDIAPFFPVAKGFGKILDLSLSFILIPVMRNMLSYLRQTPLNDVLPLDDNLKIHRWTAYTIGLAGLGHILCHFADFVYYENFLAVPIWYSTLATRAGLTGVIVLVMMIVMYVPTLFKRKIFNVFGKRFDGYKTFLHLHKLWMPIYAFLWIHGSVFWQFSLFPLMFMALEKYIQLRRVKLEAHIVEAKMASKDVLSLKMRLAGKKTRKFHYKAGQYLFLNCTDLSTTEYHPFTITSAPEDNFISVHIRCRPDMDWTYRLRQRLGFAESHDVSGSSIPARNVVITSDNAEELNAPVLHIDGPYGSAAEEVFDYSTVVLVGAGIGCTPFISVMKSLQYKMKAKSSDDITVRFFWICRDQAEFVSFKDLFDEIMANEQFKNVLELNLYVTGELDLKQIKLERYNQYSGKPNWNRVFKEMAQKHKGEDIGVFLCGPAPIAKELSVACKKNSDKATKPTAMAPGTSPSESRPAPRTVFRLHKENF